MNDDLRSKRCSRCQKSKPISDFYGTNSSYCKPCYRAWKKNRYQENPEPNRKYMRDRSRKAREIVLGHYGRFCCCCGETREKFLTIDHVNNDGSKQRKQAGVPSGSAFYLWLIRNNYPIELQTLCFNCNPGKYLNAGICPHKTEQEATRLKDGRY
jgi:hypothetical protein